jgi:hypothetical protein
VRKYYFILSIGILVLIVPTATYLIILCPQLSERYNTLMASGGIIGTGGLAACAKIPKSFKNSGLLKLAGQSLTILTVMTLVSEFWWQILGLTITIIASFIVFKIMLEVFKNGRRKIRAEKLATEVARSVAETLK